MMDETFMHFIVHLSHEHILPKTPRESRALTELTEHSQLEQSIYDWNLQLLIMNYKFIY